MSINKEVKRVTTNTLHALKARGEKISKEERNKRDGEGRVSIYTTGCKLVPLGENKFAILVDDNEEAETQVEENESSSCLFHDSKWLG